MITRCHHGGNYSTNKEVTNLHNRKQAKPHRILLFQNTKPTTLSDLHSRAQRILKLKKIIMQNLQKSKHKKKELSKFGPKHANRNKSHSPFTVHTATVQLASL